MHSLRVDVWSDVACPWCWVGKRNLEAAIKAFARDDGAERQVEVTLTWRAFELDPNAPKDYDPSVDYVERLAKKYATDRAGAQSMIDRMVKVGADSGLEFRFDRIRPGNTFDAHRLLCWANEHGAQDQLKERLFRAYMSEGLSVADHTVLAGCAEDVGLDPDRARAVLTSDVHADEVREEERQAFQIGVRGVPFFVVANRFALSGAQPPELLHSALERALVEGTAAKKDAESGGSCSSIGCDDG